VIDSSNSIFLALGAIKNEDFEAADQEHVKQEIREFCEGKREEIIDLYEVFQAHFNEFRKAAFAVVGIRST
jgi:L-fucose mutarotase/ribose pyranase (RbsD/FucU family)